MPTNKKPTTTNKASAKSAAKSFTQMDHPINTFKAIVASGVKNGIFTDYQVFNMVELGKAYVNKADEKDPTLPGVIAGLNVLLGLAQKYSVVKLSVVNEKMMQCIVAFADKAK